jgi:teichuronopeptide biosynthesis TupA-like protein
MITITTMYRYFETTTMRHTKGVISSIRSRSHLLRQWAHDCLPDRWVHTSQFRRKFGRRLNLAAPQTFNEKLHWLMLYYRVPEMTQIADKYAVRTFVTARVGGWILNELYGVWDDPEAMAEAVDRLPHSFVLKVTSGSGQNILCGDKSTLDIETTKRRLAQWMRRSEYWVSREWAYKNIKPRIICERLLTDEAGHIPPDYKFFCFDGEPRIIQVDTDRFTDHRRDLFDLDWKPLPFSLVYPPSNRSISRPAQLDIMLSVARALSAGFPFVRVDLYSTRRSPIFGEMTWYPEGGFGRFSPAKYDLELGQALNLPSPFRSFNLQRLLGNVDGSRRRRTC